MFDELAAGQGTRLMIAVAVVGVALFLLYLVFRLIRGRAGPAFIRGSRNRAPRLAVLDAAAVDDKRRLVLVRRDGIEHLLLIGGPIDVVVERGIGLPPQEEPASRSGAVSEPGHIAPERAEPVTPLSNSRSSGNAPTAAAMSAALPLTETLPLHAEASTSRQPQQAQARETTATSGTQSSSAPVAMPAENSVTGPEGAHSPSHLPSSGGPEEMFSDAREQAIDALDMARERVLAGDNTKAQTGPGVHEGANNTAPALETSMNDQSEIEEDDVDLIFEGPLGEYRQIVEDSPMASNIPDHAAKMSQQQLSTARPERMISDFEALLDAEFAGTDSGDLSTATANRTGPEPANPDGRQKKNPDDDPHEEMERLLGDLSIRP